MVIKLEIAKRQEPFEFVKVFLNDELQLEEYNTNHVFASIDRFPSKVWLEFFPHKITSIVRVDDVMLNFWLANVTLYDHYVEFTIDTDFFDQYRDKDIQGRLNHVASDEKTGHYLDKYIGIDNLYPEIIKEIKELLAK